MHVDWQTIIVIVIVSLAALYLVWRGAQAMIRKRSGCGSCGSCPSNEQAANVAPGGKPLVQLGTPPSRKLP